MTEVLITNTTKSIHYQIGHFRVAFCLCFKTSPGAKPFIWKCVWFAWKWTCEWKLFSYERLCTRTRFETEAKGNICGWCVGLMVRVWALAWVIVLCSWSRHFTLTVPPFTQEYKWVPANCQGNPLALRRYTQWRLRKSYEPRLQASFSSTVSLSRTRTMYSNSVNWFASCKLTRRIRFSSWQLLVSLHRSSLFVTSRPPMHLLNGFMMECAQ